uniref:NADH-ubiquinone oxidoreductase chain 3 n=1 Tax=Bemisia afer TaxID=166114 RepID=A0A023J0G3_BEMAF|nr:NADH dehydrogenase subunit 3 [Bemisia afer]AHC02248.1 NADH dehydrogenase subunit 3 [Bemisia afer]
MAVIFTLLVITFMTILSFMFFMMSIKAGHGRVKFSTFECGMDILSDLRLPFSLHFYFVSIVFLIFDVELMLILPFVFCLKMISIGLICVMVVSLMSILALGFVYEWWTGLLNWMI